MSILVTVVLALIALCCVALAFYLIEWVLGALGIGLPPREEQSHPAVTAGVTVAWTTSTSSSATYSDIPTRP